MGRVYDGRALQVCEDRLLESFATPRKENRIIIKANSKGRIQYKPRKVRIRLTLRDLLEFSNTDVYYLIEILKFQFYYKITSPSEFPRTVNVC